MADFLSSPASAGAWAALIFLWFGLSLAYRLNAGKPIFSSPGSAASFVERWASGRLGTGLIARLSTAKNCLQVQVDRGHICVSPHFPFTLGFVPEVYAMDHVVPLGAVRSATIVDGRRAKIVEVRFLSFDGQEQVLQLLLRNAEGFIHAVLEPNSAA